MEEHNRKFRAAKTSPLRALHQNNIIWKRKRTSQDNGEFTLKRFKHCSPINEGRSRVPYADVLILTRTYR